MKTWKRYTLTAGLGLLITLGAGSLEASATPRTGDWEGSAEFGTLAFVVNDLSTAITSFTFQFASWTCGPATLSGGVTLGGSWAITSDQFTVTFNSPTTNLTISVTGTFGSTGETASGTWDATSSGTACSGTWNADAVVAAEPAQDLPSGFELSQNYPNPFNPSTTIAYVLPTPAQVSLTVFDMQGREVAVVAGGWQAPGRHHLEFDAAGLAGGVYVYRLQAAPFAEARFFTVIR